MDTTTAIPLHFTLQALGIAAAGLVLAWALVRAEWFGALGAWAFGVAGGLHAGRFLADDNEPVLVVLRLVGLFLISLAAVRAGGRLQLYGVAGAAVAAGTAWGAAVGGGVADLSIGAHALVAVGSVLLGGWAWLASRDSIRLRVLTALVGMLAIVVVAGGGSVSRVAALDKRNEELRRLGDAASSVRDEIQRARERLVARAVNLSFSFVDDLSSPSPPIGKNLEPALIVVDVADRVRFSTFHDLIFSEDQMRTQPSVRSALAGSQRASVAAIPDGLAVVGASPIYRPGAEEPEREDVIGAVAVAELFGPDELRRPGANVLFVDDQTGGLISSVDTAGPPLERGGIVIGRAEVPGRGHVPAAATAVDGVRLLVTGSDEGVVEASTGLLRALLVAILAAAVFAAASALWVSQRLTRPILDLAEGAEQAKTDFLSSLSHELRTPLTPIRGYTELLRKGRVPPRRAADYLDEIGDAAGRLERIVMLLLDVAAQEAGRFHVEAQDTKPEDVLEEAAARWKHRGRKHPVVVSAGRSLPRMHADPSAIGRVLDELIDNAIKFSPDGGEIQLRARKTKEGIEISVADSGIGLSPEQASELTRAFAQADSGDRRRYGGLGLGLAFVSGVLGAHDGTLTVRSEPGRGATFSFVLPTTSMVTAMPA